MCNLILGILQKFGECSQQDAVDALLKCIYDTDCVTSAIRDSNVSQHISVASHKQQVLVLDGLD